MAVAAINKWLWSEESGQWFENVHQTHLALATGPIKKIFTTIERNTQKFSPRLKDGQNLDLVFLQVQVSRDSDRNRNRKTQRAEKKIPNLFRFGGNSKNFGRIFGI